MTQISPARPTAAAVPLSGRARMARLPDGRRLHLQDGPIDLVIDADGEATAVEAAFAAAAARFVTVLDELCGELDLLRRPARPDATPLEGRVARRMWAAVAPHAARTFVTPMAAVAGAVADEILAAMVTAGGAGLARAHVNDGGDIAVHLAPGAAYRIGLVDRPERPSLFARAAIEAADGIGGIATSGAPGRSFSLGIADAVTILARTAADADAAATIVANAVDLPGHPGILRAPASTILPDSDLGDRLVTRAVPALAAPEIAAALAAGAAVAEVLVGEGRIAAALLRLQGHDLSVGRPGRPLVEPVLPSTGEPRP